MKKQFREAADKATDQFWDKMQTSRLFLGGVWMALSGGMHYALTDASLFGAASVGIGAGVFASIYFPDTLEKGKGHAISAIKGWTFGALAAGALIVGGNAVYNGAVIPALVDFKVHAVKADLDKASWREGGHYGLQGRLNERDLIVIKSITNQTERETGKPFHEARMEVRAFVPSLLVKKSQRATMPEIKMVRQGVYTAPPMR